MHGLYKYCAGRDHAHAMSHVSVALRRGSVAEARQWLGVAERIMHMQDQIDEASAANDKRKAWR